jgi:hypothetical protein
MTYREDQRTRAIKIRDSLFNDPGGGIFNGIKRDFVLKDPSLNLWGEIRKDAVDYFKRNRIPWWRGNGDFPTGHLLSSQVACINHLFFVHYREDVATALLKRLNPNIEKALIIDDGFVEFEYIGKKPYMPERGFTRGANCTSIDAVMFGITNNQKRILFLIEWKYTELYERQDRYIPERAKVYDSLITSSEGPFITGADPRSFYFEPFYQMMRQTLLGDLFVKNRELTCEESINVHVIPDENIELKKCITSRAFHGADIHETWRKTLKSPDSYIYIDPEIFLESAKDLDDTRPWLSYLKSRYW